MMFVVSSFRIALLLMFFFTVDSIYAEDKVPSPTPSYRKKDIEFEDRVIENSKRTPLDSSYSLNPVKNQFDLHKKRTSYSIEIQKALSTGVLK